MSVLKTFLKNARKALSEKDNAFCVSQAEAALEIDPQSYNAYVFLGLAYTNMIDYKSAQKNYERATTLEAKNLLGWQGLLNMFEKSDNLASYIDTASRIAAIHAENGDEQQCYSVIEKTLALAKDNRDVGIVGQALKLILPVSPFFNFLQERLPQPADTYLELATLLEDEEATKISSAIAKGRTRLGVKLEPLTREVKFDVYSKSQLESIYEEIINWSLEEAVRREAEEKLLVRIIDKLESAPDREKAAQVHRVLTTARGMTIVKVPNALAWRSVLDWTDSYLVRADLPLLMQFISLFPETAEVRAMKIFLYSNASPVSETDLARWEPENDSKKKSSKLKIHDNNEAITAFIELYEEQGETMSLYSARMLLHTYVVDRDWAAAIEFANICKQKISTIRSTTSIKLNAVQSECDFHLAMAMSYYRSPRFHGQALELFDAIIASQDEIYAHQAMIGRARILRSRGHSTDAKDILTRVLESEPQNSIAQLEIVQCMLADKDCQNALKLLLSLSADFRDSGDRAFLATIYYSIGQCYAMLGQRSDMYTALIQCLRYDPNHASTYTALGLYYSDDVQDSQRAEKCFQRALELSSTEIIAAERLATTFADDGDWELVQIIAQRVIQGNEFLQVAWPYRATGFVHLNKGRYPEAVSAFQAGLRLATRDTDAWIGLGEAYVELGRFTAAEKAFDRASSLDQDNWHARYLGATVASALGEHEKACTQLESLVGISQSNGIKSALASAYILWARALSDIGSISMAVEVLVKCFSLAIDLASAKEHSIAFQTIAQAALLVAKHSNEYLSRLMSSIEELEGLFPNQGLSAAVIPVVQQDLNIHQRFARLSCHASVRRIELEDLEERDEAILWYSIGRALQSILPYDEAGMPYKSAAILALRCAVKLDPTNDGFWSALGTAVMSEDQAFGQHCLIKAIAIDERSALHWTNLGFCYWKLYQFEAANQALQMAQTLDPSSPLAWLGQACIARDMGEADPELFEHAASLGSLSKYPILAIQSLEAKLDRRPAGSDTDSSISQSSLLWSVEQAMKAPLRHDTTLLLQYHRTLLLESSDILPATLVESIGRLADTIEAAYEEDESDENLKRYCDVKAILARLHYRSGSFQDALDAASAILELEPTNNRASILSCRLVVGLSQYQLGQEESIDTLQELYTEIKSQETSIALAQVLAVSTPSTTREALAVTVLKESETHKDPSTKLLLAALIAKLKSPAKEQTALARNALVQLQSERDSKTRKLRDAIERVLEKGSSVLHAQVHQDPTNTKSWLMLAETSNDTDSKNHCMSMALHSAHMNQEIDDLAMVCRVSTDAEVRVVGLHLAPHVP